MAINTKIILANDDLSNWENSSRQLKKGEVALAKRTDGSYEIKIGAEGVYNDANIIKLSADQVIGLNDTITSLSTTHYEISSVAELDALSAKYSLVNGDTAVVKAKIADTDKDTYTAYVYDKNLSAWKAMDGNYRADNVYFDEDITLAGSYTNVGNVKISDGTLSAKGMTVEALMNKIFDQTVQPSLSSAPTNSISLTNAGVKEVGTKITPAYSVTFNEGKYLNSWNNTLVNDGTTATAYSVSDGTTTKTTATGTFDEITVTDGTNYKLTSQTTYSDGEVAKDNKGKDSSPVVQRTAGTTASANSSAITGFRYVYIGSTTSTDTVDETMIKGLSGKIKTSDIGTNGVSKTLKASGGDITLVSGAKRIIVACPTGSYAKNLTEVKLVSASNTPITSDYKAQANVEVSGATAGANKIEYKVWIYEPASIDAGEVHSITIK